MKYRKCICTVLAAAMVLTGCGIREKMEDVKEQVTDQIANKKDDAKDKNTADNNQYLGLVLKQEMKYDYRNNYNLNIYTSGTYPELEDETAEQYPKLADTLAEYEEDVRDYLADQREELEDLADEITTNQYTSLFYSSDIDIMRADEKVLSLHAIEQSYSGGAHGSVYYQGINFDPKTGEELFFADVVTDEDTFFDLVNEKMEQEYPDVYQRLNSPEKSLRDSMEEWTVDYEGITVYYNETVLGEYALESQAVTVYFDEAPEAFAKTYTKVPENYILKYPRPRTIWLDCDGDGTREYVELKLTGGDGSSYFDKMNISAGNQSVNIDYYSGDGDFDSYIVHANDTYYMYIQEYVDGDDRLLHVIDLEDMTWDENKTLVAEVNAMRAEYQNASEDEYTYIIDPFYNPAKFTMSKRMDTLSTVRGKKVCYVGKDGYPKTKSAWFDIESQNVLRSKKEIECDEVDEKGNVIGRERILKDSYIELLRTDGYTWIDVQEEDSDGTIYRLYIDHDEWPYKVNDMEEDAVFDGVIYVG